jgi:hypothetical protein
MKKILLMTAAASLLLFCACKGNNDNSPAEVGNPSAETTAVDYSAIDIPVFSADSAYSFVAKQLSFGNRIPGSKGWERCAEWIATQMARWCDTVIVQDFRAVLWNSDAVPGKNIIAQVNPAAERRIILAAHWDSRQWADHDPAESNQKKPVPGANDGASGVALLMEMARVMNDMPLPVGIDFIFFDVEDQGAPEGNTVRDQNDWCLGSQHWSNNRHVPYASYHYGILFDMVGTPNPRFTKEGISRYFAPGITDNLWKTAESLGYGNIFVNEATPEILDDHYFVNSIAHIPMVDIVQNDGNISFFQHWHTVSDDINSVSRESLATVATVVMKTLYADFPPEKK